MNRFIERTYGVVYNPALTAVYDTVSNDYYDYRQSIKQQAYTTVDGLYQLIFYAYRFGNVRRLLIVSNGGMLCDYHYDAHIQILRYMPSYYNIDSYKKQLMRWRRIAKLVR